MVKTEDVQNTKIKYVVDYNLVTFEAQDSICFNIAVDSSSNYRKNSLPFTSERDSVFCVSRVTFSIAFSLL